MLGLPVPFEQELGTLRTILSAVAKENSRCVGEGFVSRPHLLGESAQGILLLNLGEVEGEKELLEDNEE